jgi:cell division protease FtsH
MTCAGPLSWLAPWSPSTPWVRVLGQRTFGQKEELIFLGREIAEQRDYGEEIAAQIDKEIRAIVDRAYARATEVLTTHRDRLNLLAQRLIEKETLEGAEYEAIVNGSGAVAA